MHAILPALPITESMTWEITWALILGFALSAVIQAVVRRPTVVWLLGDARPGTLAVAAGLGAASSSCSYAAVALARTLFRKGADFTAAMTFEIASTNLVIELGVIDDRNHCGAVPGLPARPATRCGTRTGGPGPGGLDGGALGNGHVCPAGRLVRAAAAVRCGVHVSPPRVRDGMGRDHPGPGDRAARRGGDRGVGAGLILAVVLLRRAPAGGEAVGTADRPGGGGHLVRLLGSGTCRWR
jgi:hypothetical protein